MDWNGLVQDILIPGVSLLEKIVRPLIVYAFLLIGLRLAGRRELAQLNSFDLVVLLMLSNTVQNAIVGNDNSVTGGIIGAAVLLLINALVVKLFYKHPRWSRVLEGQPVYLIRHGRLNEKELARQAISKEELEAIVRRQGFDNLKEVEESVLETNGTVTVVAKPPTQENPHLAHLKQIQAQLDQLTAQQQKLLERLQQTGQA
jgi:uncharacterized membrane protein YcaP (DUF421 family)